MAVSAPGQAPWVSSSTSDAIAGCAAAGKRLCTEAEWQQACRGPSNWNFPYSNTYQATTCNGLDSRRGAILSTGSMPACQGGYTGLFDMSGNAYERTGCANGTCRIKGGSYRSSASAGLLACSPGFDFGDGADTAVAFRCCMTP